MNKIISLLLIAVIFHSCTPESIGTESIDQDQELQLAKFRIGTYSTESLQNGPRELFSYTIFKLDEEQRIMSSETFDNRGNTIGTSVYEYVDGRIVMRESFDENGDLFYSYKYEYNGDNLTQVSVLENRSETFVTTRITNYQHDNEVVNYVSIYNSNSQNNVEQIITEGTVLFDDNDNRLRDTRSIRDDSGSVTIEDSYDDNNNVLNHMTITVNEDFTNTYSEDYQFTDIDNPYYAIIENTFSRKTIGLTRMDRQSGGVNYFRSKILCPQVMESMAPSLFSNFDFEIVTSVSSDDRIITVDYITRDSNGVPFTHFFHEAIYE